MKKNELPLPRLLSGEKIILVKEFNNKTPESVPSTIKEITLLANAKNPDEIGDFGPVVASAPLPEHANDPAFRLYEVLYGRDSLRVAYDLMADYPKLARTTIINLATLQGVDHDVHREEEVGRIIHESRNPETDKIAQELTKARHWGWPYYGTVDATPDFIKTLAAYCRTSSYALTILDETYEARDKKTHKISDSLVSSVNWLEKRLDSNPEGLLEFKSMFKTGLENQVWKDSWDSYFHKDGTIANHEKGIASIEVQSAAYDALLDAAELYERHLRLPTQAIRLRQRATDLRKLVLNKFWTEDQGGFFIIGTDRDDKNRLRQLSIKTSNMGHVLNSRLLTGQEEDITHMRQQTIRQLFSSRLLGLNGIMTLASDEYRFREGSYHNGSVWAWDNYFIGSGLKRHGYIALCDYIEQTILNDVDYAHRYVECLRGGNDSDHRINNRIVDVWDEINKKDNRIEQPPQDMQAWTVGAILEIKRRREKRGKSRLALNKDKRALESELLSSIVL